MQRRVVIRHHMVGINNTYCSVPLCNSHATKNPELSFHRFPVNDELRRKTWISLLRMGKKVSRSMRVCSKHFRNTDYYYPEVSSRCPRLLRSAVPSLNLPDQKQRLGPKIATFRIPPSEFTKAARILATKQNNISENNQISEAPCDDSKTSKTITAPLSVSSLKPGTVLLVFPKKLKSPEIVKDKSCEQSQSIEDLSELNNGVIIEEPNSSKDKNIDECDKNLKEDLNILEKEKEKLEQTLLEKEKISEAPCDVSKTSETITAPLSVDVSSLKPGNVLLVFPKKLKSPEIVKDKRCEQSRSIEGVKRIVSKSGGHIPLKRGKFKFSDDQLAILEHYYEKDAYPDSKTKEKILVELNKVAKRSGGERVYIPVVNIWFKKTRTSDSKKLRQQHDLSELNNGVRIEKPNSSKDKTNDECDKNLEEELNILEREKEKLKQTLLEKEKEEKHLLFITKLTEVKFMVEQALEEFKSPQSYQEETVENRIQALQSKVSCLKS